MSSTPLNKNKVKQKPVESCEKQEIPQAFRGRVIQKQKKPPNPGHLEAERFQGEAQKCGMFPSSLQRTFTR